MLAQPVIRCHRCAGLGLRVHEGRAEKRGPRASNDRAPQKIRDMGLPREERTAEPRTQGSQEHVIG